MSDRPPVALTAPLEGASLIEASAGTGKTWTIAGLFVRLVVEAGLSVEKILAVTFTRAATAELRERIRRKLQDTLETLQGRPALDPYCLALARRLADPGLAIARLTAALRGFDDAPIYTIHGYCQRVLGDRAFSTGMPFDSEVLPSVDELLVEVVQDYWRTRVALPVQGDAAAAQELFVAWLIERGVTPDALRTWVKFQLARHGMRVVCKTAEGDRSALAGRLAALKPRLAAVWAGEREAIVALLETSPSLNWQKYRRDWIGKWADKVDEYFLPGAGLLEVPDRFDRFSTRAITEAARGQPPMHEFFDLAQEVCDTVDQLTALHDADFQRLRRDLLEFARRELRTRGRARGVQFYDDLLVNLDEALKAPGGGILARALRERYPAALIDEFQDTDPLQYAIFRRIYRDGPHAGGTLFLVGDPKQAIYSFRGADLFAYLDAARLCDRRHALDENQRSVPALVAAVSEIFAARAKAFRFAALEFVAPRAAPRPRASLVEDCDMDGQPLRFFLSPAGKDGKPLSKGEATEWAASVIAAEAARLLANARAGKVRLGKRPLRAGDLCVLVNNHFQATRVRGALARLGIACAEQARDSVFASAEAEQLERLMLALHEPQDERLVRAALASDLFGCSGADLAVFDEDELAWEGRLASFVGYQSLWRAAGFMRMFRRLMVEEGVAERQAGFFDGERRLTNLYHLAELLHAESARRHGAEAQIAWLASRRRDTSENEDAQLRLESDENLVQIVTIHKSKGLEYPVTFVPFLWDGATHVGTDGTAFYHDPAAGSAPTLDLGSDAYTTALAGAREEELAERIRHAYVALTRAKNRCYVFWGRINEAQRSPLAWLLHGVEGGEGSPPLPSGDGIPAAILTLAGRSAGAIAVAEVPAGARLASDDGAPAPLAARVMPRPVPAAWRLASFSSLNRAAHEEWRAEAPDHDQSPAALVVPATAPVSPGGDRFSFPRGPQAGDCLHAILERIAFAAPPDAWRPVIEAALRQAGFSETWAADVESWLRAVLATPLAVLGGPPPLAEVGEGQALRELEFHLPLATDGARLAAIAQRHGVKVPPLPARELRGYLKGFVDLVFRHDGRFYLVDYKSNWLGAASEDYARHALQQAMAREGYHLQVLLYTVALRRWLVRRIPDFDYERHMGGAYYLFLRGMGPEYRQPDGVPCGVYATRPARALIEALDEALGQSADQACRSA